MSDTIGKLPARGQAWSGDWRARLVQRLAERSVGSVTELAEARPRASTLTLADELSATGGIDRSDVAAEQLVRVWREEAAAGGAKAVARMARRLLVGELVRALPDGWPASWDSDPAARAAGSRVDAALSAWVSDVGEDVYASAQRVVRALFSPGAIPSGWSPTNADDPTLVALFETHWG